jgi:hypothetical protein
MKSSRRRFLLVVAAGPVASKLAADGFLPEVHRLEAAAPLGQERFPQPHFIRYDQQCFTINDRDTFIFSGAFHYTRCPRELWRDRLMKFKAAGLNTVETYVFWNYHEPSEGKADLSEFEAFVELVQKMGFWMIARPGPYVCAEWDAGGFPHWVVARRFPLRSNHPESIRVSQHWFDQVLPVIRRHLVTAGGPIIMVQIENEYDYWKLPDADKRQYIRALAKMAWSAGVDVPLITCWTRQVRERTDPDMARVMDTCNFYPRWNIVKEVVPALAELRQQEPDSPLGVTELQGGWFSEFGGKLSEKQDGVDAAQLSVLTKTVFEQGATYTNYYMGFGGTNFDWAAAHLTTSYDYAAPVREPGGLWDKYYAVRSIGASLRLVAPVLVRASKVEGARSTNPAVSVTARVNGKSAILFVRENTSHTQHFKLSFPDPSSPSHRFIELPRQDDLALGPREMKMLPVQVPVTGTTLCYSTAEVLAHGSNFNRPYLILYDEPGRLVELSLGTETEPTVEGEVAYQYWDEDHGSVVFAARVTTEAKLFLVNNHLMVVLMPRERALRSWIGELPARVLPGALEEEESKAFTVPILADSALLTGSGASKNRTWFDLEFKPGEHSVSMLLPSIPEKCRVDGELVEHSFDRHWHTAHLTCSTPPLPAVPQDLLEVQTWVETFELGSGEWLTGPLRPLEEMGVLPYGYVKYRAEFTYNGEPTMYVSAFGRDRKWIFINGQVVPVLPADKPDEARNLHVQFGLSALAHAGTNTLEIAYEAFGSFNFGPEIAELKGIESVRYGHDPASAKAIETWKVQRFPAAMRGREVDPEFSKAGWSKVSLGDSATPTRASTTSEPGVREMRPAFTWCRADFALQPTEGWSIPWRVTFEADWDALLYLNGKFVGRYRTVGPQKDFFLPEPYLRQGGRRQNVLTIILAYTERPSCVRTLRVSPYREFATRRTRLELEW